MCCLHLLRAGCTDVSKEFEGHGVLVNCIKKRSLVDAPIVTTNLQMLRLRDDNLFHAIRSDIRRRCSYSRLWGCVSKASQLEKLSLFALMVCFSEFDLNDLYEDRETLKDVVNDRLKPQLHLAWHVASMLRPGDYVLGHSFKAKNVCVLVP